MIYGDLHAEIVVKQVVETFVEAYYRVVAHRYILFNEIGTLYLGTFRIIMLERI